MAANIGTAVSGWSTTAGSNQPDSTDLASTLREDLQAIQAAVRYLRTSGTIASAGTTDLATKSEEILSVSGTTSITALGTVSAGMIKVLVFEGALTFTHNGTSLILPGAANITTAAGDVAVMLSLGSGNWRCLDYQRAGVAPWSATPSITSLTTSGNISTTAGQILASKTGQTNYTNAGLRCDASSGDAILSLHCVGNSAVIFEQVRGGNRVNVLSESGAFSTEIATGTVYAGATHTSYCYLTADATQSIAAFDNNDYMAYHRTNNYFGFVIGGNGHFFIDGLAVYPGADSVNSCGRADKRWSVVYAASGTINTSDKRRKDHVEDITEAGAVIDGLKPVRYTWKQSGARDVGFYAQDVVDVIPEAVEVGSETIDWGMRPDRLIPFLVAELQSLRRRVAELEVR